MVEYRHLGIKKKRNFGESLILDVCLECGTINGQHIPRPSEYYEAICDICEKPKMCTDIENFGGLRGR